ncbi:MAG: hypothetical protein ABJP48_13730 [Erythrobacter sp.]
MSPQLAVSSAFATFAMACLCVLSVNGGLHRVSGGQIIPVQAELTSIDVPTPSLLPR